MSSVSSYSSVSSIESVSSITSSEDEEDQEIIIPRRPRIFRQRNNPFEMYDDREFKMRFRMPKQTVLVILDLIKDDIQPFTQRNHSITAINQLLITLRFYACGSFQIVVGDCFNVSHATVGRIIHKVTHLLASLSKQYISMPNTIQKRNQICADFFKISGFPNVTGAIDCTHVKIQSPGGYNAENFRNRKGWFSINVQAICDAKLQIMDVVARWPGSAHDSNIFNNSLIRARFENKEFGNSYLLGDSGYACRSYILTPLLNPVTVPERRYNEAHIKTRNVIERTFGVLKRRFPCLSHGLRISVQKVLPVIVATCILHNIAINIGDIDEYEYDIEGTEPDEILENQEAHNNNAVRNAVINTVFQG